MLVCMHTVQINVLFSSLIFFVVFLTFSSSCVQEWKIGRHNSHLKVAKSAKKLFAAPVYMAVKYPAYNVPLNQ